MEEFPLSETLPLSSSLLLTLILPLIHFGCWKPSSSRSRWCSPFRRDVWLVVDAKALFDMLVREEIQAGSSTDKRTAIEVLVTQDKLRCCNATTMSVSSELQYSDGLTKSSAAQLLADRMRSHLTRLKNDEDFVASKKSQQQKERKAQRSTQFENLQVRQPLRCLQPSAHLQLLQWTMTWTRPMRLRMRPPTPTTWTTWTLTASPSPRSWPLSWATSWWLERLPPAGGWSMCHEEQWQPSLHSGRTVTSRRRTPRRSVRWPHKLMVILWWKPWTTSCRRSLVWRRFWMKHKTRWGTTSVPMIICDGAARLQPQPPEDDHRSSPAGDLLHSIWAGVARQLSMPEESHDGGPSTTGLGALTACLFCASHVRRIKPYQVKQPAGCALAIARCHFSNFYFPSVWIVLHTFQVALAFYHFFNIPGPRVTGCLAFEPLTTCPAAPL